MNENERQDLELLKQKIREAKLSLFDYLRSLDRMTSEQLRDCGHGGKTNAEAMRDHFKRVQKEIEKLRDAHVRKYPD
jgi:flagellar biosynthesis/type III secretory pathway chaperone